MNLEPAASRSPRNEVVIMNQCPNCKKTVPENAQHCPYCGHSLSGRKLSPVPFFLVGFALLIISGILLGNYLKNPALSLSPTSANPSRETTGVPTQRLPSAGNNPIQGTSTKITIPPTRTSAAKLQPTPTFDWSECHATYSTRLGIGDSVVIGSFSSPFGYNVLSGPYQDKDKVGAISPGDKATIIAGPSCSNRWIWWIIKLDKNEVSGWLPEGDANSFWLLLDNASSADQYAKISREVGEVNLRRSPGYVNKNDQDDVIVKIPTGATVKLLDGPQEADGLNWWYVEWSGYKGWIAEKSGSGRTIMIFNP